MELPIEIEEAPYPHPYILIWIRCSRQANPLTGETAYPEPDKGYLDQDAELMMAFEVMDEYRDELKKVESQRSEFRELVQERLGRQSY